ncbi:eukaryotic integral membrane protein-domain-containing protein [Spinellus fusiger]|nr:eukaryotic integral membrane protein-domain-containing protein [Spinellus fusiger]
MPFPAAVSSAITSVPLLTRGLVTVLLVVSCFAKVYLYYKNQDPAMPLLQVCSFIGLVPGLGLYTPWTFLTATFYESNVFSLMGSLMILLLCGKYLERAWGSRELLKYVLLTAFLSNVVTWVGILFTYYLSKNEQLLYSTQICGMSGVFSGFLVAFKHLIPEHRLSLMGAVSIRVKNLLGIATAASLVCFVLFDAIVFYNLVNIGWVIGWVYLRFFKIQDGVRGDHSETFAFVTFFPEFLHPLIRIVSGRVYTTLVRLGCCHLPASETEPDLEEGTEIADISTAESERRRALALKALDKRLSAKASTTEPPLYETEEQQQQQAPEPTKQD